MILRLTHYFIPLRLSISLLSQYSFNDIIYLIIFPYITKKKKKKISAFFPHICVHCDSVYYKISVHRVYI